MKKVVETYHCDHCGEVVPRDSKGPGFFAGLLTPHLHTEVRFIIEGSRGNADICDACIVKHLKAVIDVFNPPAGKIAGWSRFNEDGMLVCVCATCVTQTNIPDEFSSRVQAQLDELAVNRKEAIHCAICSDTLAVPSGG